MYFWLAGTLAGALYEEGRDWDAHEVLMREAFESATLRGDRARLLTLQRCMRLRAARISPSGRSGFVTSLARPRILTSSS